MKNKFLHATICGSLLLLLLGCFSSGDKDAKGTNSAKVDIPNRGIIIDAKYDPRLDNLIPGFKIVTVALTNNGYDMLKLNPLKDRWEIVDAVGQPRKAVNSLRIKAPHAWGPLPQGLKTLIEYPVAVSMGYSENIDLFFPHHLDLSSFRSISFYSAERDEKYDILTNLENENQTPLNPPAAAAIESPKKKRPHP